MEKIVEFTRSSGFEMMFVFLLGAFGYGLLELFWRGRTHYSMLIAGGLCFFIIYYTNLHYADKSLLFKCFIGMLVITLIEFSIGILVNKVLQLGVWDYSMLKFNIMGQISLLYSALWFLLGIPLAYLVPIIHRFLIL